MAFLPVLAILSLIAATQLEHPTREVTVSVLYFFAVCYLIKFYGKRDNRQRPPFERLLFNVMEIYRYYRICARRLYVQRNPTPEAAPADAPQPKAIPVAARAEVITGDNSVNIININQEVYPQEH